MKARGAMAYAATVALAAGHVPALAGGAAEFDNVVSSRYVHCAFYASHDTDLATGNLVLAEGRADSLTHFQRIDSVRGVARAISTRKAGAREVRVARNGRYLHFIEHAGGMYVLTTVHSCIARDGRSGVCVTYGASQARHFDSRVVQDPDRVFESLRADADPGFCDHSFIGMQEAARGAQ